MIKIIHVNSGATFERVKLFYTLEGNERSVAVLRKLQKIVPEETNKERRIWGEIEFKVFESPAAIDDYFESRGIPCDSGIPLADYAYDVHFRYLARFRGDELPDWAKGAVFGVRVGKRISEDRALGCAHQIKASFIRHWNYLLSTTQKKVSNGSTSILTNAPWFPWGAPKKREAIPQFKKADLALSVLDKLNSGPNLSAIIADLECAAELPPGSRISWYRVADAYIECDAGKFSALASTALQKFEKASCELVAKSEEARKALLTGVNIKEESMLREYYLHPAEDHFSVRRPDFHWAGNGVSASENDEMPGGMAELVHVDACYGVNQDRWENCFEWLTSKGLLVFVVSSEWSKCYIPEFEWLVRYMRGKGYDVAMVTTDELQNLSVSENGVLLQEQRVETVWRQFPIFETEGKLADLVRASKRGLVRMIPEFAHFGNKSWFALFRSHRSFFESAMKDDPDTFRLLDGFIPCSHLVLDEDSFPCVLKVCTIDSMRELKSLDPEIRDMLVLKVAGANSLSARSYGVLMGHKLKQEDWIDWIERKRQGLPFIIQERFSTAVATLPVLNTRNNSPEGFRCRMLLRPWVLGEKLVSIHACAVPSSTLRVHGRVDMAIAPVVLK